LAGTLPLVAGSASTASASSVAWAPAAVCAPGAGISASRRGGATRLSFHLYNTREDAIAAADVVRRVL
jgi:selenocysteine lyase/cysteine desulfurase